MDCEVGRYVEGGDSVREVSFLTSLPPTGLRQGRKHWRHEQQSRKNVRNQFYLLGKEKASIGCIERYTVHVTMRPAKQGCGKGFYCPQDLDNAAYAVKPAIDGLVDAGLLAGDRHDQRVGFTFKRVQPRDDEPMGWMMIVIKEVE